MHDTRWLTMVVRLPPDSASQASADHADQRVEFLDAHAAGGDEEDPEEHDAAGQDRGERAGRSLAERVADAVAGRAAEQGGRDRRDAQPGVSPQDTGAVEVSAEPLAQPAP